MLIHFVLSARAINLQKDLSAVIYEHVISSIVSHVDPDIQELKVLGRQISTFVSRLMERGESEPKLLHDGMDFVRFIRGKKKYEGIEKAPTQLVQAKDDLIDRLVALILQEVEVWCVGVNLETFFQTHRAPFFELQHFFELVCSLHFLGSLEPNNLPFCLFCFCFCFCFCFFHTTVTLAFEQTKAAGGS